MKFNYGAAAWKAGKVADGSNVKAWRHAARRLSRGALLELHMSGWRLNAISREGCPRAGVAPGQHHQNIGQQTSMNDDEFNDLETRVYKFEMMELPGQPRIMHMGTAYLVMDLWRAVKKLRKQLKEVMPGEKGS